MWKEDKEKYRRKENDVQTLENIYDSKKKKCSEWINRLTQKKVINEKIDNENDIDARTVKEEEWKWEDKERKIRWKGTC